MDIVHEEKKQPRAWSDYRAVQRNFKFIRPIDPPRRAPKFKVKITKAQWRWRNHVIGLSLAGSTEPQSPISDSTLQRNLREESSGWRDDGVVIHPSKGESSGLQTVEPKPSRAKKPVSPKRAVHTRREGAVHGLHHGAKEECRVGNDLPP